MVRRPGTLTRVRTGPDDELRVRLVSDPPPPTPPPPLPSRRLWSALNTLWQDRPVRGGLIFVLILAVLLSIAYALFDSPLAEVSLPPSAGPNGLTYSLRYFPVLSAGDDQTFTITLVNTDTISITQTLVTLSFPSEMLVTTPPNAGTGADFGTLAPGETKTRAITVRLESPTVRTAQVEFMFSAAGSSPQPLVTVPLTIPPVPYLRRGLRLALGILPWLSGVVTWLFSSAFGELFPRQK